MNGSKTDALYAFKPNKVKRYPDVVCSYAKDNPIQYRRHGTREWVDWDGSLELLANGFDWRSKVKRE